MIGMAMSKLTTAQIGKCGELLVQFKFLCNGVESAPMTTDYGVDLVAYSSKKKKPLLVQVKANLKPKPGGGKGRPFIGWRVPLDSPAEIFAFVDLESQRVWLFNKKELDKFAQERPNDDYYFFMTDDEGYNNKANRKTHSADFMVFLLENRLHEYF